MFASAGLGGEGIFEKKIRQNRTLLIGTEEGEPGWRWSFGPYVDLEAGLGVDFWGPLGFEVALGPALSVHNVDGKRSAVVGMHSRLGLSYAF